GITPGAIATLAAAPVAPPHQGQEDYLDRAPTSRQFLMESRSFLPARQGPAWSRTARRRASELAPAPPLLGPVDRRGHGQDLPQRQRLPAADGTPQEQQVLLQVRGEMEQAYDLTHARPADVAKPGSHRVAGDRARTDQAFDVPGQSQQPRDPWHAGRR